MAPGTVRGPRAPLSISTFILIIVSVACSLRTGKVPVRVGRDWEDVLVLLY